MSPQGGPEAPRSGPLGMVPSVVFDDRRLTDTHRAVLGLVSTYANRDRWCHVKLRTLADRRGCSPQAVSRVLARLAEVGYLEVSPQFDAMGSQRENQYRIVFDVAEVDPPSTPEVDPPSTSGVEPPSTPEVEAGEQPRRTAPANSKPLPPDGGAVEVVRLDGSVDPRKPSPIERASLRQAIADACGIVVEEMPRTSFGAMAKVVAELLAVGATPEEVRRRADHYLATYEATLTPTALLKHWAALAEPPRVGVRLRQGGNSRDREFIEGAAAFLGAHGRGGDR